MKNYTLAALISACWVAASILLRIVFTFIEGITGASMATAFIISSVYSILLLFINLFFFIQIPRKLINGLLDLSRTHHIWPALIFGTFVLFHQLAFYLVGWFDGPLRIFDLLLLANAVVNSIAFGITFASCSTSLLKLELL
jgi:hypothetical protein